MFTGAIYVYQFTCVYMSFGDCLPVFTPLYLRLYLFTYVYPCSTTVLEDLEWENLNVPQWKH